MVRKDRPISEFRNEDGSDEVLLSISGSPYPHMGGTESERGHEWAENSRGSIQVTCVRARRVEADLWSYVTGSPGGLSGELKVVL